MKTFKEIINEVKENEIDKFLSYTKKQTFDLGKFKNIKIDLTKDDVVYLIHPKLKGGYIEYMYKSLLLRVTSGGMKDILYKFDNIGGNFKIKHVNKKLEDAIS